MGSGKLSVVHIMIIEFKLSRGIFIKNIATSISLYRTEAQIFDVIFYNNSAFRDNPSYLNVIEQSLYLINNVSEINVLSKTQFSGPRQKINTLFAFYFKTVL
jgi:hypothetical protein